VDDSPNSPHDPTVVLKPPPRSIGQTAIRFPLSDHPPFIYAPNPIVLGMRGCIKGPTSEVRGPKHEFIIRGNPHLTSWFCTDKLGLTTNYKNNNNCIIYMINKITSLFIDICRPSGKLEELVGFLEGRKGRWIYTGHSNILE
jgi:hypothetical protein